MKRRLLSLIMATMMIMGMLPTVAMADDAVAATEPAKNNEIYQIGTAGELLWFANAVNGGETGIHAVLTADIDLSSVAAWPGIGSSANNFAGSFDGQGHTVNFKDASVGLFGSVLGSSGNIVNIKNVITSGTLKNSGIAKEAGYAHFTGCINRATIVAYTGYVAGIVGKVIGRTNAGILYSDVLFTDCGNDASITSGGGNTGGIVGYSNANTRVNRCYNKGDIYANYNVGGIAGYLQGSSGSCSINNSYNTGAVSGTSETGGIIGDMHNTVSVSNTYNAGSSIYAIEGYRFDATGNVYNSYFLGTKSYKSSPDRVYSIRYDEITSEIKNRAYSKTAAEMSSSEFAALLGDAFKQSCPTPVLVWEEASDHTMNEEGVCTECHLNSTEKEIYDVTFEDKGGVIWHGESRATQDGEYTFSLTVNEGYRPNLVFTVKINGEAIAPNEEDGTGMHYGYTVSSVKGPMSVTVIGVDTIKDSYPITLPKDGNGYIARGAATVMTGQDYTFTIEFVDYGENGGFKKGANFKVIAEQVLSHEELNSENPITPEIVDLYEENGVYTITKVDKPYKIIVSGVEAVSDATADITFTITEGYYGFHSPEGTSSLGDTILNQTITVPYFDLSMYGLERYYYNEYCYKDENGKANSNQRPGNAESAFGVVTAMHAYVVATEMFYLGYDEEDAGRGIAYAEEKEAFEDAISWSQGVGSSFMNFWDHGTNLNYYVNYEYPLGIPGWGSTSDQIALKDGDVLSVHLITGVGSGSDFQFFTVNDSNSKFNYGTDVIDYFEVDQGQKLALTLFKTVTGGNYSTSYKTQANKQLYWIDELDFTDEYKDIRSWVEYIVEDEEDEEDEGTPFIPAFGKTKTLVTDANGKVTLDTSGVEPGTYYFAVAGGFTEGGGKDDDGFESAGTEAGPGLFVLVVNEYKGKLGDVNGDTQVTPWDATLVLQKSANFDVYVNDAIADVNGDDKVTPYDATLILQYAANIINVFPVETNN